MPAERESDHRICLNSEPSPEQRRTAMAQLRQALLPPAPIPTQALQMLYDTAREDTGGSQAARSFLFWLAGCPDPTGYAGNGGLELRRLDTERREAALEVLRWWSGPVKSSQPLYDLLSRLCGDVHSGPKVTPIGAEGRVSGGGSEFSES